MLRAQVTSNTATGVVAYKRLTLAYYTLVAILVYIVVTYLEHLNEGNAEIEVRLVSTDQAQTEEEANWHYGTEVDTASHLNLLPSIEEVGGSC